MSVRLRISVLRLRQLSIGRLYDRVEQPRNLHLARLRQERCEPPPRVRELPARPLRLAVLSSPAGSGEVAEAGDELVGAETFRLVERAGRLAVLATEEMALGAPEDALEPRVGRRPLGFLGSRVVVHGDDRA
jgi:hypothetical protein